jgi:hypothetical protein
MHAEGFCRRLQQGLANADFDRKRAILELLVDRVVVTNGHVEIRYVVPTSPDGERHPFWRLRTDYLRLVPSLDREKPVRGPDAGSGPPTASPLRASSRATAGDHRHAKRQVSRRARPRGYDGAKKLVGPKRVAMVDADGRVLALAVVPANLQDRDTLPALDSGKPAWPSLRLAVFNAAFTAERCEEWGHLHGMRRRVVERTFGWLSHGGGLQRERAGRLDVATGRLACLASLMAANALNNPA